MRRTRRAAKKIEWTRLPDADSIVAELIRAFHPHLEHARIACVGKPKAHVRHGKINLAKAVKVGKFHNVLIGEDGRHFDYAIQIGLDRWANMAVDRKRIVLDHECCHFSGQDERGEWTLRGHDVEEFACIIRRYGLWNADIELFAREIRQLELPGLTAEARGEAPVLTGAPA